MLSPAFAPVTFDDLPGWRDDDQRGAFEAFRRSAIHVLEKPYKTGSLGVASAAFDKPYAEARASEFSGIAVARDYFERHFVPALVDVGTQSEASRVPAEKVALLQNGLVTGFYEPEVEASPVRTDIHTVPLLCRPTDLIDIDDGNRPEKLDSYLAFGRETANGIVEYHDRAAIEQGALADQGLALAWLESKVDAFFIHVQGAARLRMPDGSMRRITYAAKSGQRFSGPGRILADLAEIPLEKVTMQSIRTWFAANPDRIDEILWQNRSYIFFREAEVDDPSLGPIAAAKVPLTPGRSLAVDRLLHTFGTPFFIHAPDLTAFDRRPFRRLMIAQDTGSAIVGAARGDLFAGSGDLAGEIAGVVRANADFFALLPRVLVEGAAR
jgi:membrane-bound lytic murein transglycosylase A